MTFTTPKVYRGRLRLDAFSSPIARNCGAALFISLMFLIILTLIGLSAANVGVMQERMAGNVRESNLAFQAAEATLREIERELSIIGRGGGGALGAIEVWSEAISNLGIERSDCTLSQADPSTWGWQSAPFTGNDYELYQITDVPGPGGLVSGSPCAPMFSSGDTPIKPFANVYLIGARAEGPAGVSEVVLQSIYSF